LCLYFHEVSYLPAGRFLGQHLTNAGTLWAYQYDFAYGNKIARLRTEAKSILLRESHRLAMPAGPVSIELVDASITGSVPGATADSAAERFAATQGGSCSAPWQPSTGVQVGVQLTGPARAAFYAHLAEESASHLRKLP